MTRKFSDLTLMTALEIAKNNFNEPLIIHGSKYFRDRVNLIANEMNLKVEFDGKEISPIKNSEQEKIKKTFAFFQEHFLTELPSVEKISASKHSDYVNRTGNFERRGDCIFTAHQLPSWAKNDPKKFFAAAEKFENDHNSRYQEIQFSLPNELTSVDQYREIIEPFLQKHFSNHYYAYAIHEKIGAMSENERHPHVHLMFSERLIDDVEKVSERLPENYFKYPARKHKDGSEPTFDERWERGAKRDRKMNERSYLYELRADFAKIQNEVLERNGFSVRVDHRSLKAQKAEAEQNGNKILAQILDREPERPVGVMNAQKPEVVEKIRAERRERQEKIISLSAEMLGEEKILTKQSKDNCGGFVKSVREFLTSAAFLEIESDKMKPMKDELSDIVDKINALENLIVDEKQAEFLAKLQYLSDEEKKTYKKFAEVSAELANTEKLIETVTDPETNAELKELSENLEDFVDYLQNEIKRIEEKLSEPKVQKNIASAVREILQGNRTVRTKLDELYSFATEYFGRLKAATVEKTFAEAVNKVYTSEDVLELLKRRYSGLKNEVERLDRLERKAAKKIISRWKWLKMFSSKASGKNIGKKSQNSTRISVPKKLQSRYNQCRRLTNF